MQENITGKIIAKKRKEKGLNQLQLGELLNVSNRTISKWENGDGLPDISILPELAKALDVTIDELLTGEMPPVKEVLVEKKDTKKLIRVFRSCYIVSLFFALFGALLGTITELYSMWAFRILFYTHWEIIFVAAALFAIVASGLVFMLGLNQLHFEYEKKELIIIAGKRSAVLATILASFPISFVARIISVSAYRHYAPYVAILLAVIFFIILFAIKHRAKEIINEKSESTENTD